MSIFVDMRKIKNLKFMVFRILKTKTNFCQQPLSFDVKNIKENEALENVKVMIG